MRVDQLLPTVVAGDAISVEATEIQRRLKSAGFDSEVYAGEVGSHPPRGLQPRSAEDLRLDAHAVIYHLSVGSNLIERFVTHPGRRVVIYHNLTPPYFFEGWDPPMVEVMQRARRQLQGAGPLCDLGIGDSEFNRVDLEAAGFRRTGVVPVMFDTAFLDVEPDPSMLEELRKREQGRNWLFVGRFAPHKCQTDLVRAFAAFKRAAAPEATLILVGSAFTSTYRDAVSSLAEQLGVAESVMVCGSLSSAALQACYRFADVFVCLSEHEGFCVPLVEAMYHRLPVVAFEAAAVPDTIGQAAVLLEDKDPLLVAATVDEVLRDGVVRKTLEERALSRLEELQPDVSWTRLKALLAEVLP